MSVKARKPTTLAGKQITTHSLRHSLAMDLLRNGLDVAVVALWLGHEKLESVNAYVHADPDTQGTGAGSPHTAQSRQAPRAATSRPTTCSPSSKASSNAASEVARIAVDHRQPSRIRAPPPLATRHYGRRGIEGVMPISALRLVAVPVGVLCLVGMAGLGIDVSR